VTSNNLEEIRRRLVNLLQVDRINIFIEGPLRMRDGLLTYNVTICGDLDVDEVETERSLQAIVSNGEDDNGLAIEAIGDLPGESEGDGGDGGDGDEEQSGAATMMISTIALAAAALAL
jgi:hypothetical protein